MAQYPLTKIIIFYLLTMCFTSSKFVSSQTALDSAEQEALYKVLESINSDMPWRTMYPDDLCTISAPHGVVCDFFSDDTDSKDPNSFTPHVTELNFGYVSDYSPNPPCSFDATLNMSAVSSLSHLRKLFFYKCFVETSVSFPDFSSVFAQNSSLEELVFVENPGLVGALDGKLSNVTSLRRLVLTGNNICGRIPRGFGELVNLEQLTLSRNKLGGEIPFNMFNKLANLKILDLSGNGFEGNVPRSIGGLKNLLKIDLSYNNFSGQVPEDLKGLENLEFLDFSYNQFGNFGVPVFLGEMRSLKEVYLSGNFLGGQIPEIWENLGGILGIGLSGTGLVGEIPPSMGVHLRSVCYLGLDDNKLEGKVPEEFGALEFLSELKLNGNLDLCVGEGLRSAKVSGNTKHLKLCKRPEIPRTALVHGDPDSSGLRIYASYGLMFVGYVIFWF